MCAYSLGSAKRNHYEIWISDVFKKLEKGYARLLTQVLQMRVWLIGIFMILVITGIGLFRAIPTDLEPNDTIGVIGLSISGQNNTSTDFMMEKLNTIEQGLNSKVFSHSFGFVYNDNGKNSGFSMNTEVTNFWV